MATLERPIVIEQGVSFTIKTEVSSGETSLDLTGYSAKMQVRRVNRPRLPPVLDLETGSGIVFEAGGIVFVTATAEQTRAIPSFPGRNYRFNLILRSPTGFVHSLVSGRAVVRPGITDEFSTETLAAAAVPRAMTPTAKKVDYSWLATVPRSMNSQAQAPAHYQWLKEAPAAAHATPTPVVESYQWLKEAPAAAHAIPPAEETSPYNWLKEPHE